MTARNVAIACGVAAVAIGAIDRAAAFEDRRGAAFNQAAGTAEVDVDQGYRARDRRDDEVRGAASRPAFVPYVGFGIDKVKLSMDFGSGDLALRKDKGYTRPRLIFGMGYAVTESVSLALEYRALASDEPLFSLDIGSRDMNFDTRFNRHNLFLRAQYRF